MDGYYELQPIPAQLLDAPGEHFMCAKLFHTNVLMQ